MVAQIWDRFIRSTTALKARLQAVSLQPPPEQGDAIIDQRLYSAKEETYRRLLAEALSVSQKPDTWIPLWPIRRHPGPHIRKPSVVLDLPDIENSFCSNLVDWSSSNFLTVAFPHSVYLWHPPTSHTLRLRVTKPSCITWNQDGTSLFIASKIKPFKILNMKTHESIQSNFTSKCHLSCHVTSAAFHPKGHLICMGCSRGAFSLYQWREKLHQIMYFQYSISPITSLKFSCHGNFFAMTSMCGLVGVYSSKDYNQIFKIKMQGATRALAWHPWKQSYMVVADSMGLMCLYDVLWPDKDCTPLATYTSTLNSGILALTFSPLTGELVVSHRIIDQLQGETQINVLASFDRVMNRLEGHTGSVQFLIWGPDGTKLASVGSDETARIWNFIPQSKKQPEKTKSKQNYATDSLELASRLGMALR